MLKKVKYLLQQEVLFPLFDIYLSIFPVQIKNNELKKLFKLPTIDITGFSSLWFSKTTFNFYYDSFENFNVIFSNDKSVILEKVSEIAYGFLYYMNNSKVDFTELNNWSTDFVNNFNFPSKYYKLKLSYRELERKDIVFPWKLNRHQFLFILSKAFLYTNDEKYTLKAFSLIEDWINKNPYGVGINWRAALEVAFRSVSWIWTLEFLKTSENFRQHFETVLKSLILHARHIRKNLSKRKIPNNHLVGEAWGLFILGLYLNPLKESRGYLELSKDILEREIINQFYPDGGNKEHAFQYARLSADFFLQVYIIGKRNNIRFSESFEERLKKIYDFFLETMTPDFIMPSIGDGEDSMADRLSEVSKRNPIPILATLSLVFKDEIEDFIDEMPVETYFLLGDEGYDKFKQARRTHKTFVSTLLPNSGLCVMRSGTLKEGLSLFFDVGPQGLGDSGHGHADSLSIVVYAHGKNLIIDPGTYVYNANHDWRNFFRGTSAHNTIRVDSLDQGVPHSYTDPFGWKEKADGHLLKWYAGKSYDFASGYHEGYMRFQEGVKHTRSIFFNKKEGYWFIIDTLEGKGEHFFELFYHLHPSLKVESSDDNSIIASCENETGLRIIFLNPDDYQKDVIIGAENPIQGWFSSEYNSKEPAPVINFHKKAIVPIQFHTIIQPFMRNTDKNKNMLIASKKENQEDYRVYVIEHYSGIKDEIVVPSTKLKNISYEVFETDAEFLLFSKDSNGKVIDLFFTGSFLKRDGKSLFKDNQENGIFEIKDFDG